MITCLAFVITIFSFGLGGALHSQSENNGEVAGVKETIDTSESTESETQKEEDNKRNEELRIEAEKVAREEKQKRENLENLIAEATVVNWDISFDDNEITEEIQQVTQTQEANKSISQLGSTTRNKKLFDVMSVVDGDTIKISELGTIRLIGMDTPETKDPRKPVQCFGEEASRKASELLGGKKVYLEFDPANRIDKYGRTLAYVFREDDYFFNKSMIQEGFAHSFTQYPHPRLDEFNEAQRIARESNAGLWSPNTCGGDTTKAVNPPAPTQNSSPNPQQSNTNSSPGPAQSPVQIENQPSQPGSSSTSGNSSSPQQSALPPSQPQSFIYNHSGNNYNCGDFSTWEEANRAFQESLQATGKDIHQLDGRGEAVEDGIPCESLL